MATKRRDIIRENAMDLVNTFGCVRKKTLLEYMELYCSEEDAKKKLKIIVGIVPHNTIIEKKSLGEMVVLKNESTPLSLAAQDAFEIYVALLKKCIELGEKNLNGIQVAKARYPYDYVMTTNKTTYLVMLTDDTIYRRLNHHNRSQAGDEFMNFKAFNEAVLFIITSNYRLDEFKKFKIIGNYRMAMVQRQDRMVYRAIGSKAFGK